MKIDILIPIASASQYVEEAIESASNQKVDSQIYIIENNISDKIYSNELKRLANKYNAKYIYFESRLPMFENWQRCLTVGNSEWVTFLHDDDIWSPFFLNSCSNQTENTDIIFYSYKYFDSSIKMPDSDFSDNTHIYNSREELLANVIDMYEHMSSSIFRRKLNLIFPSSFKMIGDQYALRNVISKNKTIKVAWIESNHPNNIRLHPNQVTNSGVLLYEARENAICYRLFFKNILQEDLSYKALSKHLIKSLSNTNLTRIFSATLFYNNFKQQIIVFYLIIIQIKSATLIINTLARIILQNAIWSYKIRKKFK